MNAARIAEALYATRVRLPQSILSASPGVYVLWLGCTAWSHLSLQGGRDGIAYVGVGAGSGGLRRRFRKEWRPTHSGRSSPRRSLGALLVAQLGLEPIPRPDRDARRGAAYYQFGSGGEAALTEWIQEHTLFSLHEVPSSAKARDIENDLIKHLRPPLNLTSWANPQRSMISAARSRAAQTAARSA